MALACGGRRSLRATGYFEIVTERWYRDGFHASPALSIGGWLGSPPNGAALVSFHFLKGVFFW